MLPHINLKNLWRTSATGATISTAVAPNQTGEFIGSRISGLFNGIMLGIGKGILKNPAVLAVGAAASIVVGSKLYNALKR